jgi:two-component system phosphate regulon sensor histidine kinase PhoR
MERCTRERSQFTIERQHRYVTTGNDRDLVISYAFVPPDLVMVHTEDVTERRLAERERDRLLAEASALAAERETTLGQIVDGIVIANAQGDITFLNDAGRRILGVDAIGIPLEEHSTTYFIHRPDGTPYPSEALPLSRALLEGETVVNEELHIHRPGAREVILSATATPLVADDGTRLGAVATFRDTTADRELEREKEDFLAAAAHDLKTPLTTIKGVVQLLDRRAERAGSLSAEDIHRQVERIDTTASKMNALIGTLLDLTRLELNHPLDLVRSSTDLVSVVRQVTSVQRFSDRHHLIVRAAVDRLPGEWDVPRLERVIANLVTNAVKYSPAGGDIHIDLSRDGDWAVLAVRDSGLGIPADDLPHIFERFFRARNVIDEVSGAGIGLAACKRIVEQHGGELLVESREGMGSTFTVRLPLESG